MRCHFLSWMCLWLLIFMTALTQAKGQSFDHFPNLEVVEIPFQYQQGFILVDLKLDGKIPMRFIWDTGAENTILFERLYSDLIGATYDMRIPIVGSSFDGDRFALVSRDVRLDIADLPSVALDILVLEEYEPKLREYLGTEVHGIIGSSFFKNYILEIDYKRERIYLHKYQNFSMANVKGFREYEMKVLKGKPYLHTTISFNEQDSMSVNLLMDTGAGTNLLIHTNTDSLIHLPDSTIRGELGVGVSGILKGYVGRIYTFQLGSITYRDMITSFQDVDTSLLNRIDVFRNGIIGNDLLSRFRIIWDYPREKLYLKPERKAGEAFIFDRSGITLIAVGPQLNQYEIQRVWPGSPADEAGLMAGDQLLSLQCWPMDFYTLKSINRLLKKRPGKKIGMRIRRGSERKTFRFRLRELI